MATKSDVINFRASAKALQLLDALAERENRSRSNLLDTLLIRVLDPERQAYVLEQLVAWIHKEDDANGPTGYGDYLRGSLHGAKWMLTSLLGEHAKDTALDLVRERLEKPIPHIGPYDREAKGRMGFDSDAG